MLIMSRFFPGTSSSAESGDSQGSLPTDSSRPHKPQITSPHVPSHLLTGNSKPSEPVPAMHRHPPKQPAAPVPILPAAAAAAAAGEKRKAAGSPIVENPARRIKLVYREGDKADP